MVGYFFPSKSTIQDEVEFVRRLAIKVCYGWLSVTSAWHNFFLIGLYRFGLGGETRDRVKANIILIAKNL
jgi:hypothetical protein